jgi:hypothetical protein
MRLRLLLPLLCILSGCLYANRAPGTVAAQGGDIREPVDAALDHCRRKEVDLGMVWRPEDRERCVRGSMGEDVWQSLPRHPHLDTSVRRWIDG